MITFPSYELIKSIPKDKCAKIKLFHIVLSTYCRMTVNEDYSDKLTLDLICCGYIQWSDEFDNTKKGYEQLQQEANDLQQEIIYNMSEDMSCQWKEGFNELCF